MSLVRVACNTPDEVLFANVVSACKRGLPAIAKAEAHSGHAVLCGSGPSLLDCLEEIQWRQSQGQTIFALNNAAKVLALNGIWPSYQVIIDPRPQNTMFVEHDIATKYLIASVCAPELLDALEGRDVCLFHPLIEGIDAHISGGDCTLVGGGITVGLSSMALVHTMGFREMHLYGYDSSYRGEQTHASEQPINEQEAKAVEVECGGKTYRASLTMVAQAEAFPNFARTLSDTDAVITVHGDGLLPTIAREMTTPHQATAESESLKYRRVWEHKEYREWSPGEDRVDQAIAVLHMLPHRLVIDFGCGTGRATKAFERKGMRVLGVDFARNCLDAGIEVPFLEANLWEMPQLHGDYGFCCDVMEHIPPEHVDAVLAGIKRSVPAALFTISFAPDAMGTLTGEPLHLTVRPCEWWLAKLKEHFTEVSFKDGAFLCASEAVSRVAA